MSDPISKDQSQSSVLALLNEYFGELDYTLVDTSNHRRCSRCGKSFKSRLGCAKHIAGYHKGKGHRVPVSDQTAINGVLATVRALTATPVAPQRDWERSLFEGNYVVPLRSAALVVRNGRLDIGDVFAPDASIPGAPDYSNGTHRPDSSGGSRKTPRSNYSESLWISGAIDKSKD